MNDLKYILTSIKREKRLSALASVTGIVCKILYVRNSSGNGFRILFRNLKIPEAVSKPAGWSSRRTFSSEKSLCPQTSFFSSNLKNCCKSYHFWNNLSYLIASTTLILYKHPKIVLWLSISSNLSMDCATVSAITKKTQL